MWKTRMIQVAKNIPMLKMEQVASLSPKKPHIFMLFVYLQNVMFIATAFFTITLTS